MCLIFPLIIFMFYYRNILLFSYNIRKIIMNEIMKNYCFNDFKNKCDCLLCNYITFTYQSFINCLIKILNSKMCVILLLK